LTDSVSLLALLEALRDRDPTVRVAGVTSLKARPDIDANGKNVLFQLFVKDSDIRVRNAAAVTLAQLGAPSEEFLAALAGAAQSENSQLKKSASAALALLQNKRSAPSGS